MKNLVDSFKWKDTVFCVCLFCFCSILINWVSICTIVTFGTYKTIIETTHIDISYILRKLIDISYILRKLNALHSKQRQIINFMMTRYRVSLYLICSNCSETICHKVMADLSLIFSNTMSADCHSFLVLYKQLLVGTENLPNSVILSKQTWFI